MESYFIVSKKLIVNNNEINLDLFLEDEMFFCGTCMYYDKEKNVLWVYHVPK